MRSPGLSLFQFSIYFVYFLMMSVTCFAWAGLDGLRHCRRGRHQPLAQAQELRSPLENSVQAISLPDGDLRGPQPLAPPPQLLSEDGMEDSRGDLRVEAKA